MKKYICMELASKLKLWSFKVDMTPELFSTLNLQTRSSFSHGHRYAFGNKSKL